MVTSKANSKTMGRMLIGVILHDAELWTVIPGHYGFDEYKCGAVGFFFGNLELSMERWTVIAGYIWVG